MKSRRDIAWLVGLIISLVVVGGLTRPNIIVICSISAPEPAWNNAKQVLRYVTSHSEKLATSPISVSIKTPSDCLAADRRFCADLTPMEDGTISVQEEREQKPYSNVIGVSVYVSWDKTYRRNIAVNGGFTDRSIPVIVEPTDRCDLIPGVVP